MLFGLMLSSLLISCKTTPVKIEYIPVYKKAVNTCIIPAVPVECKITAGKTDYERFKLLQLCLLTKYAYVQELKNYIKCLENYFEDNNG